MIVLFLQGFDRFVEIGRVAHVAFGGPDVGKLVVIVDVIDQKRVSAIGALNLLESCT